jgi:hypothetical protein
MPSLMPLTWIAAALRAELADLEHELMSSKARERLPKLRALANAIDGHTDSDNDDETKHDGEHHDQA